MAGWAGCTVNYGKTGDQAAREQRTERVRYSPEWTYQRSYLAWRVNHRTMEEQLTQARMARNNAQIKAASVNAGWALKSMQANLPEGKARQLDPVIEQYKALGEKAVRKVSSQILLARLRVLRHKVTAGFDPDVVPIVAPREE